MVVEKDNSGKSHIVYETNSFQLASNWYHRKKNRYGYDKEIFVADDANNKLDPLPYKSTRSNKKGISK